MTRTTASVGLVSEIFQVHVNQAESVVLYELPHASNNKNNDQNSGMMIAFSIAGTGSFARSIPSQARALVFIVRVYKLTSSQRNLKNNDDSNSSNNHDEKHEAIAHWTNDDTNVPAPVDDDYDGKTSKENTEKKEPYSTISTSLSLKHQPTTHRTKQRHILIEEKEIHVMPAHQVQIMWSFIRKDVSRISVQVVSPCVVDNGKTTAIIMNCIPVLPNAAKTPFRWKRLPNTWNHDCFLGA